ncbi:MAG: 2-keto-3-deoxygluconate permease [Kiritimatiellae bacterium]|nr:2-keto-3-deoxygluconate permease [Kiritimatiellia bacterium]
MKILSAVKRVPGGLMVVPLILGALVNTFCGGVWRMFDGTFTTYLWKSGAMPLLSAFIFCNATTIDFRKAGVAVYKGVLLTVVKVGLGTGVGLLCGKLFGEAGFLGLSTLAIVAALVNSNGGLYAALAGEYGDSTDVGAVSILSINDGPFFTMLALGAAGAANIPLSVLLGCIIPVVAGCILGNLDDDIRRFCEPGATLLIPFFAFPLGAGLDILNLVKAGASGILLGIGCLAITGFGGFLAYRLLRIRHPEVGAAIGTTAGNAAATPLAVAAVDSSLIAVAETATAQITAAIIVTAIGCPVLVSLLHRLSYRSPSSPSPGSQ